MSLFRLIFHSTLQMKMFAIIFLIWKLVLVDAQVLLYITSQSRFPHLIGNPFTMQIQSLTKNLKLSTDATDTMVIRIVNLNFTEIDRALLNYGSQFSIDEEFLGKCMNIKIWEKNPSSSKINISIMFKQNAHNKYLEIFYFSAPTKFDRKKYLKNLSLTKRLFHKVIDLFIPPKLIISVHPINVDRNEIMINDLVMASCRAFDGIPQENPKFSNHFHLNVTDTKYNKKNNEIKMYFRVSLRDHFSYFACIAGNVTEIYTIHIYHHSTKLYIQPIIKKKFRSNSTIKCLTTDGYPDPEINWNFIEGPKNAELFYNITRNGHQIHMNSNSPIGSKWTFKCTIKSNLTKTQKILNKIISFVIAKNPMKICDENVNPCLDSRISDIEESVKENSKLRDDLKLILNVTNQMKEQMEVQRKALKHLSNSLRKIPLPFHYIFDNITYNGQYSAEFPSIFPLTVQFVAFFTNDETFRCVLLFTNKPQIINININYICWIFSTKSPNKIKTVSFNLKYRNNGTDGISYYPTSVNFPTNEIFDNDLSDIKLSVRCQINKYLFV